MEPLRLRCVHCGAPVECAPARVPAHGVRLRCAECGGLLPLVLPPEARPAMPPERREPASLLTPTPADP